MQHPNQSWPLEGGHTMLNAALQYAAGYLPVFPCGLDKRPLIQDWPHRASTDSDADDSRGGRPGRMQ